MERTYENRFEDRLELTEDTDVKLVFDTRASGSQMIFLESGVKQIRLKLEAEPYSYVKVFLQNKTDGEIQIEINADIKKDARIDLGFLDLQDGLTELTLKGDLLEQGAAMEYWSGQLCLDGSKKINNIDINSLSGHTYGMMHNFAVCLDKGGYRTAASGRIGNGCPGSESHQETRVLTLGQKHNVQVIPILYIDENDVKASHALTIGQPDASQLYYLQSRGLSARQAMGLLSIGYFKPVIGMIDDEELRNQTSSEMESRVGLYEY